MVPTSESCGRSTRGGLGGGGGAFATGTDATAGGGGRRDDEKIGRSRVFDNVANGTAHSGLALGVRSGAAGSIRIGAEYVGRQRRAWGRNAKRSGQQKGEPYSQLPHR